jgi:hypothetical protein
MPFQRSDAGEILVIGDAATPVTQIRVLTASLSPVAIAANTSAEQTFTFTGISTADKVLVIKPTAQAGLCVFGARASATNTVGITFGNFTAAPITPTASETYTVIAFRS